MLHIRWKCRFQLKNAAKSMENGQNMLQTVANTVEILATQTQPPATTPTPPPPTTTPPTTTTTPTPPPPPTTTTTPPPPTTTTLTKH